MHFPNKRRTKRLRFSRIFSKVATKHNFSSVRAEQPSKVCIEQKLKIKVSDDFSQSQ